MNKWQWITLIGTLIITAYLVLSANDATIAVTKEGIKTTYQADTLLRTILAFSILAVGSLFVSMLRNKNKENTMKNKKIILITLSILLLGIIGIYLFNNLPKRNINLIEQRVTEFYKLINTGGIKDAAVLAKFTDPLLLSKMVMEGYNPGPENGGLLGVKLVRLDDGSTYKKFRFKSAILKEKSFAEVRVTNGKYDITFPMKKLFYNNWVLCEGKGKVEKIK